MKIAFFGSYGSFDYFRIGGIESFTRRIGLGLVKAGHQVDFVIYGAPSKGYKLTDPGIGLYYCTNLSNAFDILVKNYEHILTFYLPPRDRLTFLMFRYRHRKHLHFHQAYFSWPDSPWKRKAAFVDARLYPYNGRLFCVSPRIYSSVHRWSQRALLMFPPVPASYFIEPGDKPEKEPLRVTYIGRTESGKGIDTVISLYNALHHHPGLEFEIHGFHHKHLESSVGMHEWLTQQPEIRYFYTPFDGFTPKIEAQVRETLYNTDILLLPYLKLSSTIDTPVLLLEGMASLCAVITQPQGDIPELYGPSPFLLPSSINAATHLLENRRILQEERQRIHRRNHKLAFRADQVTQRFINAIA